MSTRGNYMKMPTHSRANKSKRIKWNKIPTVLCVCVCHPLSGWLKWACPFCKHMLQQLHVAPAQKQSNRIESGLIPLNEMTILFSCKSHRAPKWPAWIKARECSSVCVCECGLVYACVVYWANQNVASLTSHALHVLQLIAQVFYAWPQAGIGYVATHARLRDHAACCVYHKVATARAAPAGVIITRRCHFAQSERLTDSSACSSLSRPQNW